MRLREIDAKATHRPAVFLDMDGVLADFFSEYAKLAGVTTGNYRDIPPARTDPTLNKMIGTDFFDRLPKFASADALVALCVKHFGYYNICSSPLRGDHENSEANKRSWIQRELNPQPKLIIITPNKAKFAKQPDGTPNILVDDRKDNIIAWEAAGGVGVKYQANEPGENDLGLVIQGFHRAFDIALRRIKHTPQELTPSITRNPQDLIATPDKPVAEAGRGIRPPPQTDLKLGDRVVADLSKEKNYPGGHKSRTGTVTRVGEKGVHIRPEGEPNADGPGAPEWHPYKIVKRA